VLFNFPFTPGKRYPFSQCQIGLLYIDSGSFEISEQIHTDRVFTSGFGGATRLDVKGYTFTGKITAYIARSGNTPHTLSTNLPARFAIIPIKIWSGGYYVEGNGLITQRDASIKPGEMAKLDLSFESDGIWTCVPNVVEYYG
jgi:hypothetical protein